MRDATQAILVAADLAEYPRLIAWIEDFAGRHALPASLSLAIQLCLEEAFSNIVRHGCAGRPGEVRVTLELGEQAVVLGFEDGGIPFDPTAVAPPAPAASIEDAGVGGQGIHLMRQFSQRLEYTRQDGRNWLRLHFVFAAAACGSGPG